MESLEHLKTSDPEIEIEETKEKIKIPLRILKLLATIRRVNWIYMCLAQSTCHPPTIQTLSKQKLPQRKDMYHSIARYPFALLVPSDELGFADAELVHSLL